MASIFDDISRKITQTGQSAVQKTKDITDIARINSIIFEEEKKIQNLYLQLGKLYATVHADDYESDFTGMMTALHESEASIRQYRQQILDIKGLTHCENCGSEVAKNILFCNVCGSQMPKTEFNDFSNSVRCSSCGQTVSKNMRFCTSCGTPIVAVTPSEPVTQPNASVSKTCSSCGAVLPPDTVFCIQCGTKL